MDLVSTRVRTARLDDLQAVVAIYNQAVAAEATADTEPVTLDERRDWFLRHESHAHPILIAEIDGSVVGWASLSAYRAGRGALRQTAEISYYVDFDRHGQGIGSTLIEACIDRCPELGIKTLFAILLEDNRPSIRVLEKFGFERWGFLPDVADFSGREVGHLYYGRRIP